MSIFPSIFFVFFVFFSSSLYAEEIAPTAESQPETRAQTQKSSSVAQVYFQFNRSKPNFEEESVKVSESSRVEICLKLNSEDPRIAPYFRYLRSYQVILALNDSLLKPISSPVKFRKKLLKPDSNGCYWSSIYIPKPTHPGKYQISELDLLLDSGRSLSLKSLLAKFKTQPILEVVSVHQDDTPPTLERIEFLSPEVSPLKFGGKRAVASAQVRLVTHDLLSGIDPKTLDVYFKVYFDEDWVDTLKANCSPTFENLYYDCDIETSRASFQLRTRQVRFVLSSIYVQDKLGNFVEYSETEKLKSLNHGEEVSFLFYSQLNEEVKKIKKAHQKYKNELQSDKKENDGPSTFSKPLTE